MGAVSFRGTLALATVALGTYLASAGALVGLRADSALRAVGFAIGVVLLSRSSNFSQRVCSPHCL